MPRRVLTPDGVIWLDDDGTPLTDYNPGMGSLPGQAVRRMVDGARRLPAAEADGMVGPGIVHMRPSLPGPDDGDPPPAHTYRPFAGAKQQNRGRSVPIDLPGNGGIASTTKPYSIIETDRRTGDDAESILVVCGLDVVEAPDDGYDIEGIVTFGIGGASFSAEFDWNRGLAFAIPASFVRVAARVRYASEAAAKLVLSAALSYGNAPGGNFSPLRKSDYIGALAAAGVSSVREVPAFASGATLVVSNTTAPNLNITFYSGSRQTTFNYASIANTASQADGQFPIPPWAEKYQVTNAGAAEADNVAVIFSLAL